MPRLSSSGRSSSSVFWTTSLSDVELELQRRGPDGLEKLRDDVIEPVDFAFGDGEILLQLAGHVRRVGFRAGAGERGRAPDRAARRAGLRVSSTRAP